MRRLGDYPTMEELRGMVAEVDQVEGIIYLGMGSLFLKNA